MKAIYIDNCENCPYYDTVMPDVFVEGGKYCEHPKFKDGRKLGLFHTTIQIPKWCPLENK